NIYEAIIEGAKHDVRNLWWIVDYNRQSLDATSAKQVMDRVEHRARVRLHRDAVVLAERVEIERRHDRGHRRAARLVAADLQPVGALTVVVGVVDSPSRNPPQPLFEGP